MIEDLNLKLAIIHALRKTGTLPKFDKKKFWLETFHKKYDYLEEYNYRPVPEIIEYYRNYEISEEQLLQVKKIMWPEFDIISDIYDQWDGEDNQFEIASLDGLQLCKNLEWMHIDIGLDPFKWEKNLKKTFVSLKPLAGLQFLNDLTLGGMMQNIETLLHLPALKRLRIKNYSQILEKLEADKLLLKK